MHHQVNAGAAGVATVIFPARAVLGVPLIDRERGVLVRVVWRVIEGFITALALLQAETVGELVQVDAAFEFVDRGHCFSGFAGVSCPGRGS